MSKEIDLLVLQCKKGNKKAQLHLYDKYCEAMFSIACRYLKEEEALEAMQEGFLKAFLNIYKYEATCTFGAWLKKIVINQCIDELKKKKIETVSFENYTLDIISEEDWLFDKQISKEEIVITINKLPLKYQLVTKLYLLEGYDHAEISEILGIAIKTSRTQLRRGKLQLRKLLEPYLNEARY